MSFGFLEEKSGKTPEFAEGLDQAIVYLLQGADFAYLVHPEPDREEDKRDLKELCENFAPYVDLIFVPHDLEKFSCYYSRYRDARQSYVTSHDRKRKMLVSLVTGGLRDAVCELPLWCKKQEY